MTQHELTTLTGAALLALRARIDGELTRRLLGDPTGGVQCGVHVNPVTGQTYFVVQRTGDA